MLPEIAAGIAIVFVASLLFTDSVEYISFSRQWSRHFAGAVFTPIFTSIPELTVLLLAVSQDSISTGGSIALGTVFGEPLFIVLISPVVLLIFSHSGMRGMTVESEASFPYLFISASFPLCIVPLLLHFRTVQLLEAPLLLLLYPLYLYLAPVSKKVAEPENAPLFSRVTGRNWTAYIQLLLSISMLYGGSLLLVHNIPQLAIELHAPLLLVSMLTVPVATVLPETAIGAIWASRGRNTLAFGALSGEGVLYCTFYPFLSLLLVQWSFSIHVLYTIIIVSLLSFLYFLSSRSGKVALWLPLAGLFFFIAFLFISFL
jgi:cation:H+ antiporter